MTRKEALQTVVNIGGEIASSVSKNTNFLVIGNEAYSICLKDNKSSKMKKAEELITEGYDLQIIAEDDFFDLISQ